MMKKLMFVLLAGYALSLPFAYSASAADAAKTPTADEAAMQEMMKLSSPSEHHKLLEGLVGTWDYTVRIWMKPDEKPQELKGTDVVISIFGGRFIQHHSSGEAMDKAQPPFEGMGLFGYDNVKQTYSSVWVDNMATGMMVATGQYDPKTKTITETGTMSCPMTGKKDMPFRSEVKLTDADHYSYTMYGPDESGKEIKHMEVIYTRKK